MPNSYSNPRQNVVITTWPWGRTITTATFTIERVPGKGERCKRIVIDPKTKRPAAPKLLTYSERQLIVDGDDGKTYIIKKQHNYVFITVAKSNMMHEEETVWPSGTSRAQPEKHTALLALFAAMP